MSETSEFIDAEATVRTALLSEWINRFRGANLPPSEAVDAAMEAMRDPGTRWAFEMYIAKAAHDDSATERGA